MRLEVGTNLVRGSKINYFPLIHTLSYLVIKSHNIERNLKSFILLKESFHHRLVVAASVRDHNAISSTRFSNTEIIVNFFCN